MLRLSQCHIQLNCLRYIQQTAVSAIPRTPSSVVGAHGAEIKSSIQCQRYYSTILTPFHPSLCHVINDVALKSASFGAGQCSKINNRLSSSTSGSSNSGISGLNDGSEESESIHSINDNNSNISPSAACSTYNEMDPILWYNDPSDRDTGLEISKDLHVYEEFINDEEEKAILEEIEPYMSRLHYEYGHWDDAIHGYRETEKKNWTEKNKVIIERMKDIAFPPGEPILPYVHILDIEKTGYIKPHVDSVRFCGSTIVGLCLMSPCVMKLVHEKNPEKWANILLKQRALYIMRGSARYDYTHEILSDENSIFKDVKVPRGRRISIICRNEKQD